MTEAAQHIPCTCEQVASGNLQVVRNQSVRLSTYVQLRRDPTHTTTLRNQFSRAMGKRFRELRGLIRKAIVDQDCFGLQNNPTIQALPQRRQFDFPRSQDKVSAFMDWLRKQEDQGILEIRPGQQVGEAVENAWSNQYIQSGYQRGVYRARQELVQAGYSVPGIEETGGIDQAFNQPFHMDRVGLMYTRTFNELKGITDAMDQQISRVLSQAMAEGRNPNQIAQLLTRTISGPSGDLGLTDTLGRWIPAERRARIMARTEVIRAHHAATIQEYKNWGVEGVRVRAEWSTAGDARVCARCAMMEGRTYTLKEAEGIIPLHPQCRCIALPKDVTDVEEEAVEEKPLQWVDTSRNKAIDNIEAVVDKERGLNNWSPPRGTAVANEFGRQLYRLQNEADRLGVKRITHLESLSEPNNGWWSPPFFGIRNGAVKELLEQDGPPEVIQRKVKVIGEHASDFFEAGSTRAAILFDHEFAHKLADDLERIEEFGTRNKLMLEIQALKAQDLKYPTVYARTNKQEWFAENYALWKNGREDVVDDKFLELIKDWGIE